MSGSARRLGWAGAVSLVLAGLTVAAAVRALRWEPPPAPRLLSGGVRDRALALAARLSRGLVAIQTPQGEFDPDPEEPDPPDEIRRTIPAALSAAALARARSLGVAVEGQDAAIDRTLDLLKDRQRRAVGGGFGALPPDRRNPWAAVEGISTGLMALAWAGREADGDALRAAAAAHVRAASYGLRDGRTRGLALLSVDALFRTGHGAAFGKGLLDLVTEDPKGVERVDCSDWSVVEAIARRLRAGDARPPYSERVLATCVEGEAPRWTGESTDTLSWWLQAWLAARLSGGETWFQRVLAALEEGLGAQDRIPTGLYGDSVEQTACALLVLGEGLSAQALVP